jgi:hypothetical protein
MDFVEEDSSSPSFLGSNKVWEELSNGPTFQGGHIRYSAMPTNNFLLTGPWSSFLLSLDLAILSPSTQIPKGGTDVVTTLIPVIDSSILHTIRRCVVVLLSLALI